MRKAKKILSVFTTKQKWALFGMGVIILIDAFVELLGVSIIIPFINMITDPEMLMQNRFVQILIYVTGFQGTQIIVFICISIIVIYILKNLFLIFVYNLQFRFVYHGQRNLRNRFMKYYLNQTYSFHLQHNTAELIRNIMDDTNMFYETVLAYLQLITELVVCVTLVVYLILTDFWITLGIAVSLMLMLLFLMGSYKKTLARLGNERRIYSAKMTQSMQEGFGGIKEIKVAGSEEYFQNMYANANNAFTTAYRKNYFLNAIPKPIMEMLCIAGLMSVIAIKILAGTDSKQFVGTLAVFAVATFRLLPSVNKISTHVGTIMHIGVAVDSVCAGLNASEEQETQLAQRDAERTVSFEDGIHVRDLSFAYDKEKGNVLEDITLDIRKNSSVAFIGPSGAGKTTLVDLILGLYIPNKGDILVDQTSIRGVEEAWRKKVGYIPQTIYLLDDSIRNNVAFGKKVDDKAIWDALEQAQLKEFVESLPEGLDTFVGEGGARLSGGQRQRIGIARALYHKPELLVLDEATSALDGETEAAVMEAIESLRGKLTMIIIAHRLSTIEKCDEVFEVKANKVNKKRSSYL